MRFGKVFLSAILLLAVCFSVSAACGTFRRGLFRARAHRSAPRAEMVAASKAEAAASCPQCPGGVCKPLGPKSGCGCCDGCACDADSCPCKTGKGPCAPGCRCLIGTGEVAICQAKPAVDPVQFPGIPAEAFAKIGKEERFELNGRRVTKHRVIQALSTVPDDRKELSLSFIGGTEQERQEALAVATELALDQKTLIQSYEADSPLVKDRGFVVPSAYLQSPDGKVLLRTAKMDRPALEAVSARVDAYDPAKDPQPDSGFSLADLEKKLAAVPGWAWFAVVFAVLLWYQKKEIKQP